MLALALILTSCTAGLFRAWQNQQMDHAVEHQVKNFDATIRVPVPKFNVDSWMPPSD